MRFYLILKMEFILARELLYKIIRDEEQNGYKNYKDDRISVSVKRRDKIVAAVDKRGNHKRKDAVLPGLFLVGPKVISLRCAVPRAHENAEAGVSRNGGHGSERSRAETVFKDVADVLLERKAE